MTELLQKFWKVVFRQQVCHNQYWLHTDYKSESIKIKNKRIMSSTSAEMIDQNKKSKIMTFILKKSALKITFRSDISNDSDVQVLHITNIDIDNCMIINMYNEKNQLSTLNEYTIERSLTKIELSANSIICGDFNAHHAWWNFRISSSIRANSLID